MNPYTLGTVYFFDFHGQSLYLCTDFEKPIVKPRLIGT